YSPGTGPEDRPTLLCEFSDRVRQALFLQELQLCRAFAARQNQPVAALELCGRTHFDRFCAESRQHRRVRLKISLNRQNSDPHSTHCTPSLQGAACCASYAQAESA